MVTSAILTLKKSDYDGEDGDTNLEVRRVTKSWSEGNGSCFPNGNNSGLTWNQRSIGNNWLTKGGDFGSTVYVTGSGNNNQISGTEYTFNITTLINEWLSGFYANHGLAILSNTGYGDFAFYSDEAIVANQPVLVINIECQTEKRYLLSVDTNSLPFGSAMTTDNIETATLYNLGNLSCNHLFGFDIPLPCPPIICVPLEVNFQKGNDYRCFSW